jgi:hypothetical protein
MGKGRRIIKGNCKRMDREVGGKTVYNFTDEEKSMERRRRTQQFLI